jgi:LacI family transcriptional regulator
MRIQDLSKKLGVSTATISRALNAATEHLVTEPLRSRIKDYARARHFTPNQVARTLAHGRSNTIGVILYAASGSLFFSDYMAKIQWGITAAMDEHPGYSCKIVLLPRGKLMSDRDHHMLSSGVDGLLISTLWDFNLQTTQEPVYAVESRSNLPIVALNIGGPLKKSQISTVSFSNYQAAYLAVKHLIRRGHQNIGLIHTDDGAPDVAERVAAFKAALADHHLPFDPASAAEGAYLTESGYDAAIQLFKRPKADQITAVFCTNDEMAFGALRALRVLRKRCPQDVAIMGFDGLTAGDQVDPPLSTVEQPFLEIAKTGTKLLFDLIEGKQKKPIQQVVPTQLLIRDSA